MLYDEVTGQRHAKTLVYCWFDYFLGDFVCFTISRHFPLGSGNPQSLGGWGRSGCHGKAAGIWRPPLCSRLELYLFEQVIAGLNHSQIWRFEYNI